MLDVRFSKEYGSTVEMTDFANSYMTWVNPRDPKHRREWEDKAWGDSVRILNSARILIDARCTIEDTNSGAREEFYLIAPCRTERMYQEKNIFYFPSGEYRVIFSQDRQLRVGKRIVEEGDRPQSTTNERYTSLVFTINSYPKATPLETDAAIVEATQRNLPLVARTVFSDDARGLQATLEYPVRTMNIHPELLRFQVDTGPLIFPDLTSDEEHWIDRCALAHVAYNTFDRCEILCKRPTPVLHDGHEVASVFHYSDYRVLPAKHTLFCADRV